MKRAISHLLAFAAGVVAALALTAGKPPLSPTTPNIHRAYYPTGELMIECPLDSAGQLHGEMKTYHPSGRLKSVKQMHHGALGRGLLYSDDAPDEDASRE